MLTPEFTEAIVWRHIVQRFVQRPRSVEQDHPELRREPFRRRRTFYPESESDFALPAESVAAVARTRKC